MIWFQVRDYVFQKDDVITRVEVERETEQSLFINGQRSAKTSKYDDYFPTIQEAIDYVVLRETRRIKYCEEKINRSRELLALAKAFK